jgi:hypothetical protein
MSRMCTPRALLPQTDLQCQQLLIGRLDDRLCCSLVLVFFVNDAEPCCALTITSAVLNKVSLSEISTSRLMPLSSPMNSGSKYAVSYAFCEPIKSYFFYLRVSIKAHWIRTTSLPLVKHISASNQLIRSSI